MTSGADRIIAKYLIETPLELERAAQAMAGEQSTGTFIALPGETEELHRRHAARVEKIRVRLFSSDAAAGHLSAARSSDLHVIPNSDA